MPTKRRLEGSAERYALCIAIARDGIVDRLRSNTYGEAVQGGVQAILTKLVKNTMDDIARGRPSDGLSIPIGKIIKTARKNIRYENVGMAIEPILVRMLEDVVAVERGMQKHTPLRSMIRKGKGT